MVFISYARADRPRVAPLAEALAAKGFDVWWDALIEGGAGFAAIIEAKLQAADAVIVAWSATSVTSDWVRDEAAHARDRKRIVPVSLDGTDPPLGFRQYHTVDLSKWRGRADAPDLASVIAGIAGVGVGEQVAATRRAISVVDRRKALMLGGGAVAVIGGGLVVFNPFGGGRLANSVAVLPFANMSSDKDQSYFSDGLSEEIRSALARNPALKVAAPTSANTFRDKSADAKVIGSKLGVAYLLEGSVRRAGDVVRIAAELVDAKTGFSKWSQSFDRQLTDVFAVQSEIASVVSDALAVRVAAAKPGVGGTTNVVAYDAFLKGRALFNSDAGEESDRAALAQFDSAIAADPNYAAAYAARSRTLAGIANQYAKANELRALNQDVLATAQRAVKLAPDLAAAQLALGQAFYTGLFDVQNARGPFDRAAALGSGDADILVLYATYMAYTANSRKAAEAIERAVDLDRLNPRTFRTGGLVRYMARRFADAIPLSRQALALDPKIRSAYGRMGFSYLMLGKNDEARTAFLAEPGALLRLPGIAIVERRLGNVMESRAALAEMTKEMGDGARYQEAQIMAQWGDRDAAIGALKRAASVGDSGLLQAGVDPMLDPLRNDARFTQLLKAHRLM
jgi:TolB-like protein